LRLRAQALPPGGLAATPGVLSQKLPARTFAVETEVEIAAAPAGLRAGIAVMGDSHAALALEPGGGPGDGQRVILYVDDRATFTARVAAGPVRLGVAVADGGICRFSFQDGAAPAARAIDPPFTARPGRWIGAKVGLFAVTSAPPGAGAGIDAGTGDAHADFAYFRFAPWAPAQVTANPPKRYQP
jgi:hypothetical protein